MSIRTTTVCLGLTAAVCFSLISEQTTNAVPSSNVVTTAGFGFGIKRAIFKVVVPSTALPRGKDNFKLILEGNNLDLQSGDMVALRIQEENPGSPTSRHDVSGFGPPLDIGDVESTPADAIPLVARGNGLSSARGATLAGFKAKARVRTKRDGSQKVMLVLKRGAASATPTSKTGFVPLIFSLRVRRGNSIIDMQERALVQVRKRSRNRRGTAFDLFKGKGR